MAYCFRCGRKVHLRHTVFDNKCHAYKCPFCHALYLTEEKYKEYCKKNKKTISINNIENCLLTPEDIRYINSMEKGKLWAKEELTKHIKKTNYSTNIPSYCNSRQEKYDTRNYVASEYPTFHPKDNMRNDGTIKGILAQPVLTIAVQQKSNNQEYLYTIYKNDRSTIPYPPKRGFPLTMENVFSYLLLEAAMQKKETLTYREEEYQILYGHLLKKQYYNSSKVYTHEAFFSEKTKVPVYVTKKPLCEKCRHNIEAVIAHVMDKNSGRYVTLNVIYCYTCDKYYVLESILDKLHLRGCIPKIKLYPEYSGDGSRIQHYEPQSILGANGYTVAQNKKLSDFQRHQILENVIDMGLMSKNEIIYHLQGLIEIRKCQIDKDFSYAISKWESDIDYVIHYYTPDQKEVIGEIQE